MCPLDYFFTVSSFPTKNVALLGHGPYYAIGWACCAWGCGVRVNVEESSLYFWGVQRGLTPAGSLGAVSATCGIVEP